MRICDFKIFQYQLPLSRELPVLGKSLTKREGFLIKLCDEHGHTGWGETAPLAGVSLEMPDIIREQLKTVRSHLSGQPIPTNIGQKTSKFSTWLKDIVLAPSVHFGIETAVLSLKAESLKKTLANVIDDNYQTSIPINGLLAGSRQSILKEAQQLLAEGYKTFKLKVGNAPLAEDIATCNALTQVIADRAILRLDANKSWSLTQAFEFCNAIDFKVIEYIEEPLNDFSAVGEFYSETLIPVAIDESLKKYSLKEIKSFDGVEIVILKPTLLGGFEKITHLVEEAHAYGLQTILTSTFESGIGLRALANLAASYSKHTTVGLDTAKWFSQDVVLSPLRPQNGRLQIDQCQLNNLELNSELLQEI